jgi:antitoxin component YwqK of YwqJK toxin-antitoxin module
MDEGFQQAVADIRDAMEEMFVMTRTILSVFVLSLSVFCVPLVAAAAAEESADAPVVVENGLIVDMDGQRGPNDEVVVERYPDNSVKIEHEVTLDENEDFVSHGAFKAYMPDGSFIGMGRFEMGKKNGEWTRIYTDRESDIIAQNVTSGFTAPFNSSATFRDDLLHGDWAITDSEGRPLFHWQFSDGRRHGQWSWFDADGSTRKQIAYDQGQIVGDVVASSGKNHLEVLERYIDGRLLVHDVTWYSKGKRKKSEGYILKPLKIVKVHVDWWHGKIETQLISTQDNADRHGSWQFWHANGTPLMQGTYDHGVETGHFVWWHDNAQKQAEGLYVAGKMQGFWQMWHSNGGRQTAGNYSDGQREGLWISWRENGMRKMDATYSEGSMLTQARTWDAQGRRLLAGIAERTTHPDSENARPIRLSEKPAEVDAEVLK